MAVQAAYRIRGRCWPRIPAPRMVRGVFNYSVRNASPPSFMDTPAFMQACIPAGVSINDNGGWNDTSVVIPAKAGIQWFMHFIPARRE